MEINAVVWLEQIINKLWDQHRVTVQEVEEVLEGRPHVRYIERGKVHGENLYAALGQTKGGHYLIVFFILKKSRAALVISAREMTDSERKLYEKNR